MDSISAGGRQFPGTEETGVPEGDNLLLTSEEQAEIRETVITRRPEELGIPGSLWTLKKVCAYVWKRYRKKIRRQCVELYAALGIDVPASDQARLETGSFPYLKVVGGISSHRPAGQGGKCRDLLGRRNRDRQPLELRARVCTQRAASNSAGGDEKRAAEYAFRPEQAGGHSVYAVRGFREPAAPDPIYGPAGSNIQPKSFPDFRQLKGALWEESRSLAGKASG